MSNGGKIREFRQTPVELDQLSRFSQIPQMDIGRSLYGVGNEVPLDRAGRSAAAMMSLLEVDRLRVTGRLTGRHGRDDGQQPE
jgi:hypothetical protein